MTQYLGYESCGAVERGIMNREVFLNPTLEYRMKTIVHGWPEQEEVLMDAVRDFGYGGVATNPEQSK